MSGLTSSDLTSILETPMQALETLTSESIFFYSEIFSTSFSLLHAFGENKYIFLKLTGQV